MQNNTDQKVVGIVAKNSADYIRQVFSVLGQGATAVTLRSASDSYRIDLAKVEETIDPLDGTGWVEDLEYPDYGGQDQGIAQVLFTSGTEGDSKAVLISASAMRNTAERIISVMNINADIREYIGVPVYYSFGFGRCRVVSQVGGAFYIPPNGFDPLEISAMLESGEINSISAVPTLWRLLLQSKDLFAKVGDRLQWIEIGSQYMSRSEKEALKSLFPKATIVQHYGLTEASRSTFLKIDELEGEHLESVGKLDGSVEVAVEDGSLIKIRGPHLATAIVRQSGQQNLTDEDGWFVTGDAGYIKDGFLYFTGRADDLINCGGVKLSPDFIEQELHKELGKGKGIAASKVPDDLRGEVPLIGYQTGLGIDPEALHQALVKVIKRAGLEVGNICQVFECKEFPVTETGKLQRKQLTQLYISQIAVNSHKDSKDIQEDMPPADSATQTLVSIWEDVLKISPISVHDSFFDLGGDSLSAISVTMRMEKSGIPKETCRKIFEGLSIAQIVEIQGGQNQATAEPDKTAELVAIWEEVLKVSPISVHDSFFDLGGDSLSAISVTMRMEKSGIPKETCRKIFEGLSISQIVELQGGQKQATAEPDKTAELVAIWEEVLRVSPISVHDSFFDLGGDSLSAISVTMRMEKSGIPKETCRKIFEGLSISEIVAVQAAAKPKERTQTEISTPTSDVKTPLAAASQSLNIVRGILVLLNVAAHWMPGVIARLPGVFSEINKYFATLYSSGTPGFAVVYGAGIGFFFLPRYYKDPSSVLSVLWRNVVFLGVGIFCLSTVRVTSALVIGREFTAMDYSYSYWSVLTYYFYAVLSLYIWLKILTRWRDFSFACLSLAAIFYSIQLWLDSMAIPPSPNPFLQHFVLLLTAKYSYFEMSTGVLLGAAAGNWIRQAILSGRSLRPFATAGILLILLSIVISHEMGEISEWTRWPKGVSLWTWPLYLGYVLIGVVLVQRFVASRPLQGSVEVVANTLAIIGILAFPTFITHELVLPVKDMLSALGVPLALPLTLAAFFGGTGYFVHRLYSIYYGKGLFTLPARI